MSDQYKTRAAFYQNVHKNVTHIYPHRMYKFFGVGHDAVYLLLRADLTPTRRPLRGRHVDSPAVT